MEAQIPTGVERPVYQDSRDIVRGFGQHIPEMFIGQVTGAGGAGGSLLNVPFEPILMEVINEAGATATWHKFVNFGTPIGISIAAAAADGTANAPTVTRVGANDFTVALNTTVAPDAEVCTVICYGIRDVNGSL
jgi:hypothetical protein